MHCISDISTMLTLCALSIRLSIPNSYVQALARKADAIPDKKKSIICYFFLRPHYTLQMQTNKLTVLKHTHAHTNTVVITQIECIKLLQQVCCVLAACRRHPRESESESWIVVRVWNLLVAKKGKKKVRLNIWRENKIVMVVGGVLRETAVASSRSSSSIICPQFCQSVGGDAAN